MLSEHQFTEASCGRSADASSEFSRSVKVCANKSAAKRWFDSIWVVLITR